MAAGRVVDRLQRGRLGERQLGAREPEQVPEAGGELVAGEPADVMAHHDGLGERLVHRPNLAKPCPQCLFGNPDT